METKKITKKEVLNALYEYFAKAGVDTVGNAQVPIEEVYNYIDTTIAQLDKKAATAKAKAATVKANGDELCNIVRAELTTEPKTIQTITEGVNEYEGYEDISRAKVTARLTQLVKAGVAVKETVKDAAGNRIMAYKRLTPATPAEDADDEDEAPAEDGRRGPLWFPM